MKKVLSLFMVFCLLLSCSATVFADETKSTTVRVVGVGANSYELTVPLTMTAGETKTTALEGTWDSFTTIKVTAPSTVTLTNDSNSVEKVLDVSYAGFNIVGNDFSYIAEERDITVSDVEVLFGTWEGIITYNLTVETQENIGQEIDFKALNIVENGSFSSENTLVVYAGSPVITDEVFNTSNHSLKCFGNSSQLFQDYYLTESNPVTYYVACKVRLDRYVQGGLGVFISDRGTDPATRYITSQTTLTDGEFVTLSNIIETTGKSLSLFYGSFSNADLDGYIDDIVVIPLSDLDEIPSKETLDILYEDYIKDSNYMESFIEAMNTKATSLGMSNSLFRVPSGAQYTEENYTTARDIMKLFVEASNCSKFLEICESETANINIMGENARQVKIETTMDSGLRENYTLLGFKTGSWLGVYNVATICEIDGNKVVAVIMNSSTDSGRFEALEELLEITSNALTDNNFDVSNAEVTMANSAIVCTIEGDDFEVIFEQNADEKCRPASITKVLTLLTVLDYIDNMNDTVKFETIDLQGGSGNIFREGDIVTLEDAFYAMILPSSNTAAQAVARTVGKLINN